MKFQIISNYVFDFAETKERKILKFS